MTPGASTGLLGALRGLDRRQRQALVAMGVLKLVVSALWASPFMTELFAPFVSWWVEHPLSDPWTHFTEVGPANAFPYSSVMLLALSLPAALLWPLWGGLGIDAALLVALRLPLLACDLAILAILLQWFPRRGWRLLALWWGSPVVFFVAYVHGQLDLIPTALLVGATAALIARRHTRAGLALGLAAAAKLHVLVALPFLALYTLRSPHHSPAPGRDLGQVLWVALAVFAVAVGPLGLSEGWQAMVLGSPEMGKVFAAAVTVGAEGDLRLYIWPLAALILGYVALQPVKINRDLLILWLGLAFGSLVLLVPPMPGWYLWSLPLLVYFFVRHPAASPAPLLGLSVAFVAYFGLFPVTPAAAAAGGLLPSLLFTGVQAGLVVTLVWMAHVAVRSNEVIRPRDTPMVIGVGGDSAAGKTTYAAQLSKLFGPGDVIELSGDDYHRWPRGDERWSVYTHLHPEGNALALSTEHAYALRQGRSVVKVRYDHDTGAFTDPETVDPRRVLLLVGLHPFYGRRVRELADLKVYLDTDDSLRRRWKLARDVGERGHAEADVHAQLDAREPDAEQHIRPQRRFADLVIAMRAADQEAAACEALVVRYRVNNDVALEPLIRAIAEVPALHATRDWDAGLEHQHLEVSGAEGLRAADIEALAEGVLAQLDELLRGEPGWAPGVAGLNQLVTMIALADARSWRRFNG